MSFGQRVMNNFILLQRFINCVMLETLVPLRTLKLSSIGHELYLDWEYLVLLTKKQSRALLGENVSQGL